MLEPAIISVISFLLVMLMIYLWASKRNLIKNRALKPQEYLWKLKCITGKSEYEIFHIAAEEKGFINMVIPAAKPYQNWLGPTSFRRFYLLIIANMKRLVLN